MGNREKRWREAAKHDPFNAVKALFEKKDYDGIAAVLKSTELDMVRERNSVPAALLIVPNLDYSMIAQEMQARNAYQQFIKYLDQSRKIAIRYSLPTESLDSLLRPMQGASQAPAPEFARMYEIYHVTPE